MTAAGVISAKLFGDAKRLKLLAMTDGLTGLHNLRSFEEELKNMLRDANAPVSVMVLDVDKLKSLNDTYGHLYALCRCAEAVSRATRRKLSVARSIDPERRAAPMRPAGPQLCGIAEDARQ